MAVDTIRSDYYGRSFNAVELGEALELYLQWCKDNSQEPEVDQLDMIHESNINHLLYHAEMQGFVIDDSDEDSDEGD